MRVTLDIPEGLMEEARRATGLESGSEIVDLALRELVRRRRLRDLKDAFGTIELDVDLERSRDRPGSD